MTAVTANTPLAFVTIGTNVAALITLVVLFFATATSGIFELEEGKDDGDNRWYDLDLDREEREALKYIFNTLFLAIACATLFVPMMKVWHPTKGLYNRFNMGMLAASSFLMGSMLFVSFWYSLNLEQGEEDENEENNNNDNNGDDDNAEEEEMDGEELLAYERKVISSCTVILGVVYIALSAYLYKVGRNLAETGVQSSGNANNDAHLQGRGAGHMDFLSDIWSILSSATITIFVMLFLTTCILSAGEEGERMREEGAIYNLIMVLVSMIIISTGVLFLGRKILGGRKLDGTMGVGILSGTTMYFSLLLFMVFLMYANPTFEERRKEDGAGSTATAAACFFLSLLHLAFSLGMYKYQSSIIGTMSDMDATIIDVRNDGSSETDFQRMDDDDDESEVELGTGIQML